MTRPRISIAPAAVLAGATLAATALGALAPRLPWAAVAAPVLLAAAFLASDLLFSRPAAGRRFPSALALLMAATLLVACGIVAARGLRDLAEMLPIFGSCLSLPIVLRHERRDVPCARA